MGPFFNQTDPDESVRSKSSWYDDYAIFADTNYPWFTRGGAHGGTSAGAFAFHFQTGGINSGCTFRIVLAPAN